MEPASGISINEQPQQQDDFNSVLQQNDKQQNDIRIYCIFSANPNELVPNSTRWFKDGRQLTNVIVQASSPLQLQQQQQQNSNELMKRRQASDNMMLEDGQFMSSSSNLFESVTVSGYPVLTIRGASRKDAGLYDCQLANSVGFSERLAPSESTKIEVNFRPSVEVQIYKFDPNNNNLQLTTTTTTINGNNIHQAPISYLQRNQDNSTTQQQQQMTILQNLQLFDPSQEIVKSDSSFLLHCNVLEAQPNKVIRFRWFKTIANPADLLAKSHNNNNKRNSAYNDDNGNVHNYNDNRAKTSSQYTTLLNGQLEEIPFPLMTTTSSTSNQQPQQQIILLGPLGANFTPTSYFCLAENALGAGQLSQKAARLELSYLPGKFTYKISLLECFLLVCFFFFQGPINGKMVRKNVCIAIKSNENKTSFTLTENDLYKQCYVICLLYVLLTK